MSTTNNFFSNSYFISSFYSILFISIFSIFIGFYSEDHDLIFKSLLAGDIGGYPIDSLYSLGYVFYSKILSKLYLFAPFIGWHAILLIGFQTMSMFIIIYFIHLKTKEKFGTLYQLFLYLAITIFLFDQFININFTRVCIIGMLSGILVLYIAESPIKYLLSSVILILSFLLRMEISALVICVWFLYILVYERNLKRLIVFVSFCILFLIVQLLYANSNKNSDLLNRRLQQNFVEINIMQRHNIIDPQSLSSAADRVKLEAVSLWQIGDSAAISEQFMNDCVAVKSSVKYLYKKLSLENIQDAIQKTLHFYQRYLLFVVIFVGLFISVFNERYYKFIPKLIGMNFLFVGYFVFIAYWVDMENRVFSPLLLSQFIFNLLIILNFKEAPTIKIQIFIFLIVMLLIGAYREFSNQLQNYHRIDNSQQKFYATIKKEYNDKAIGVLGIGNLFPIKAFNHLKKENIHHLWWVDAGHFTYEPSIWNYNHSICDCNPNNFEEVFNFLKRNKENYFIISTDQRLEFTSKYLKVVYGIDIEFVLIKTFDDLAIKLYSVK